MADKKTCGVVMPISLCDGLDAKHWTDVLSIVEAAAHAANFDARLVSDTFESNLIHKEILQNIYQDELIVCDVSGRNPNVFFELGVRMATQKPTVIIKDNKTAYPFDTGPNRYIEYPRDLRHPEMEKFKANLSAAMTKTFAQSSDNSFIGQLGPFQIPDVESSTVPASDVIINRLDRLERRLTNNVSHGRVADNYAMSQFPEETIVFGYTDEKGAMVVLDGFGEDQVKNGVVDFMKSAPKKTTANIVHLEHGHSQVLLEGKGVHDPEIKALFKFAVENAIPF